MTEQHTGEQPFTESADARSYIDRAYRWGSETHHLVGIVHSGGPGERPKGLFSTTTYPDFTESESEDGYVSTANRMFRNVKRAGLDPWTGLPDTQ